MKYKFYQTDYRLFATSSYGCRADFVENFTTFISGLGVKPIESARPIANCLYERMLYYKLKYHTPIKTLAMIQTYQEMLDTKKIEPLSPLQELALWLYESVYMVGCERNAELSADFAVGLMSPWLGEPAKLHQIICQMSPENHLWPSILPETDVLLDFDLLPLASTPEVYQRISGLIKDEYGNDEFIKRLDFLDDLDRQTKIFRTPSFQEYEQFARTNLLVHWH